MAFVEVNGLWKYYGSKAALKGVSFSVQESSIVGFVGPNGAGKTTALRTIAALLKPSSGTVHVNGFDVSSREVEVKQSVGFLPEEDFLYEEMHVESYLRYIAELFGVQNVKATVNETMEKTGCSGFSASIIKTLSRGQRRRVSIARTLLHNPKLLLYDELTSGLDPIAKDEFLKMLLELKNNGKTIIFSTHTLDEAVKICDYLIVIYAGTIKYFGTLPELLRMHRTNSLEKAFFDMVGASLREEEKRQ